MPDEPIDGVKFSEFPSYIPGSSDELVGLHNGNNARFSVSNFILSIRQGLSNLFVPQSRTINGKGLSSDISLTAQDVGARPNTWTPSAADVGAIPTTAAGEPLGIAELDSDGKVPSSQLPAIPSQPSDIGAQDEITASGILKGDGAGGVSAATAGTDYGTYSKPSGGIPASDLASGVIPSVPSAYTSNPAMDGTASPGTSNDYARGDHVHPTDSTKAAKSDLTSIQATGTTNTTGAAIPAGALFYLNGILHRAKEQIGTNVLFTPGTNCVQVTEGGLNATQGKLHLVWTNTGTSVAFAGQTLPLDLSQYDLVLVEHLPERSLVSAKQAYVCRIGNGTDNIQSMYLPSGATTPSLYQRTISVTTSGVTFGDGFAKPTTATARTTNNNAIHPRTIYGIKL